MPIGGVAAFTAEFEAAHAGVVLELCSRRANFTCHRVTVTAFEEPWLKYQETRQATEGLAVSGSHSDPIYSLEVNKLEYCTHTTYYIPKYYRYHGYYKYFRY